MFQHITFKTFQDQRGKSSRPSPVCSCDQRLREPQTAWRHGAATVPPRCNGKSRCVQSVCVGLPQAQECSQAIIGFANSCRHEQRGRFAQAPWASTPTVRFSNLVQPSSVTFTALSQRGDNLPIASTRPFGTSGDVEGVSRQNQAGLNQQWAKDQGSLDEAYAPWLQVKWFMAKYGKIIMLELEFYNPLRQDKPDKQATAKNENKAYETMSSSSLSAKYPDNSLCQKREEGPSATEVVPFVPRSLRAENTRALCLVCLSPSFSRLSKSSADCVFQLQFIHVNLVSSLADINCSYHTSQGSTRKWASVRPQSLQARSLAMEGAEDHLPYRRTSRSVNLWKCLPGTVYEIVTVLQIHFMWIDFRYFRNLQAGSLQDMRKQVHWIDLLGLGCLKRVHALFKASCKSCWFPRVLSSSWGISRLSGQCLEAVKNHFAISAVRRNRRGTTLVIDVRIL